MLLQSRPPSATRGQPSRCAAPLEATVTFDDIAAAAAATSRTTLHSDSVVPPAGDALRRAVLDLCDCGVLRVDSACEIGLGSALVLSREMSGAEGTVWDVIRRRCGGGGGGGGGGAGGGGGGGGGDAT